MLITYKSSQGIHRVEDVIQVVREENRLQLIRTNCKPYYVPYSKLISIT